MSRNIFTSKEPGRTSSEQNDKWKGGGLTKQQVMKDSDNKSKCRVYAGASVESMNIS